MKKNCGKHIYTIVVIITESNGKYFDHLGSDCSMPSVDLIEELDASSNGTKEN
jgi:hypothetical protein